MLHFTCDSCGKPLDDERFVARIEVYPAFDPDQLTEEDLDCDHLQEMSSLLDEISEGGDEYDSDYGSQRYRFDLCPECHKKFVADPLGRESNRRLKFSQN